MGRPRAGRDYTLTTGTLTFPAGTTQGTIVVPLIDDDLDEEAETFQVELFDPVNAVLGSAVGGRLTQTGTILDDDYPQVGVSFGTTTHRLIEGGRVTIQLRLSRDPERLVEVGIRAAGGRGVQSTDFTVPTTVVFEPGETTQRIEFVSTADRFDEDDEVVVLSFTSLADGLILGSRPEVTITISDDDQRGITISEEALELVEGQSAQYRIGLTSQPTGTLSLDILASPLGSDVTVTPSTLLFTQEDWWVGRTVLVAAGQDDDALQDPVVTLGHRATGGDYTGYRAGTVRVTVTEDDAPTLSVADARDTEGAGEITFEVTLDVQTDREVRASYVTLGGTATEGVDYVLARGTLVIPPRQTKGLITVPLLDDKADEMEETFSLRLSRFVGVDKSVTSLTATGTIVDDDLPAVTLSSVGTSLVEGGDAQFRLRRMGDLSASLRVPVTVEETGDFLRGAAPPTVTFLPGADQVILTLRTEDDNLDENDGTIQVTVAESPNYEISGPAQARLTVTDNDATPALIITGAKVPETAGTISFPVSLRGASAYEITVGWSTSDQSARAGEDYEAASGTLTFASGETAGTIEVTVLDDILPEEDETFTVALSNPANAVLEVGGATGTITDDDEAVTLAWLSRFGRTVASQVVEGVAERLAGSYGTRSLANTAGQAAAQAQNGGPVNLRNLFGNSSFQFSTGGGGQEASPGGGGSFTAWGRGMRTDFGGGDEVFAVDGSVLTGLGGIDYEQGRVLAGIAVSYSLGDGSFGRASEESGPGGMVESTLGSVNPYLRVKLSDRLSVWGLGGHGRGDMSFPDSSAMSSIAGSIIQMNMGAFGARGEVLRPRGSGLGIALKSDAFLVQMSSDVGADAPLLMADAQRVRFLLEVSSKGEIGESSVFGSTLEVGGRYDGGDAETGTAVEVGGGLQFANKAAGLRVEATARTLVSHQDPDFTEWGLGGTIVFQPGGPQRGLSVKMGTSWGVAKSGVKDMWSPYATRNLAARARRAAVGGGSGGGFNAQVHYGIVAFGDRVGMAPYAQVLLNGATGTRTSRLGWRFNVLESLRLSLETDVGAAHPGQAGRGLTLRGSMKR